MNEQRNLQAIRDAYAAFARGDIQSVLDGLADDVEWEVPGPPEIPYAGVFRGIGGAADFLRTLSETDEIQLFEPEHFFAHGDMVVVLGRYAARVKSTGKIAQADWVHAFTFRGDKVARVREYVDTAKYAQAYTTAAPTRA